jgi:hypothetical protein
MKIYKWLRGLMKASALTTVMFIMQACYGVPKNHEDVVEIHISGYVTDKANGQPLQGIQLHVFHADGWSGCHDFGESDENGYFEMRQWGNIHRVSWLSIEVEDEEENYLPFDTLVSSDTDLNGLKIKLVSNP